MSIRVGFDHYTIAHRGLTPEETLEFARTHGMDGVQFLEPSVIDAGLDTEQLGQFPATRGCDGALPRDRTLFSQSRTRSREQGQPISAGDVARVLGPELEGIRGTRLPACAGVRG